MNYVEIDQFVTIWQPVSITLFIQEFCGKLDLLVDHLGEGSNSTFWSQEKTEKIFHTFPDQTHGHVLLSQICSEVINSIDQWSFTNNCMEFEIKAG
jgi:hypothetical protein